MVHMVLPERWATYYDAAVGAILMGALAEAVGMHADGGAKKDGNGREKAGHVGWG